MADQTATDRAAMPKGDNSILDRRTVENGNRNLLKLLKPGLTVLDVGCGSGAITRGIAEAVGATGRVLGIDPSEDLIGRAHRNADDLPQLRFQQADIFTFDTGERYDLITCARVLQWLAQPEEALVRMKRLLKPGGVLAILDYNHEKISWTPEPPEAMQKFYRAFLQWRQDAGFDNAIADHTEAMLHRIGFEPVQVEPQFEISRRSEPSFGVKARIWSEVADIRGPQLVRDGYLTEDERKEAIVAYDDWVLNTGESMQLYLLAVEGTLKQVR